MMWECYLALSRFLDKYTMEKNIASTRLLGKQSFLLEEFMHNRERRQKKSASSLVEGASCFSNKREGLSHDHWEFPEIVKLLSSVAGDPGVAMEDRESFCEEL